MPGEQYCYGCPPGTYSAVLGAGGPWFCLSCPFGKYSEEEGAVDISTCVTCPERFTGGAELSDAQCGICGKNYFTQDGECDLECDMFITCGGHGRCDGLGAGCICYSGFEGTDCGMRG